MAQSAAGISRERLNRVQAWMDALVGKELLPFASCLVARNGKVEFFKTASSALEAINEDSLFRLYGMSQPLTVAGLFTLWEEGKFGLDEPIKKYIPAFGKMTVFAGGDPRGSYRTVPAKTAITIRMLLTHTSGLSYGYDEAGEIIPVDALYHANNVRSGGQRTTTDVPLERFVNRLARMPLLFEPGTQWHYSLSIDVIGRLIEILSGQNLAAFLKARLFDPLEMTSTAFTMSQQDSRLNKNSEHLHGLVDITRASEARVSSSTAAQPYLSGGAGIVSTTGDVYKFLSMLTNQGRGPGGAVLLAPRTVEMMTSNQLAGGDLLDKSRLKWSEIPLKGMGFGFGFSTHGDEAEHGEVMRRGTFGWGGSASTLFWCDPTERLVVIFMSQCLFVDRHKLDVRSQLAALVYSSLTELYGARSRL